MEAKSRRSKHKTINWVEANMYPWCGKGFESDCILHWGPTVCLQGRRTTQALLPREARHELLQGKAQRTVVNIDEGRGGVNHIC